MSEPELTERMASGKVERVPAQGLYVRLGAELIEQARADGVSLTGEGGLLASITRQVLQAALEAEMTDHLGYEKGDPGGAGSGNHRNGTSRKTVLAEVGPVELAVPRDRAGSFEPRIVPKHSRRVEGFDEAVVSLYAKGLTTGEIQAHLAEIYDITVSRELISKVTDRVVGELTAWQNRPLDRTYAVLMIDAIVVKIRDGAGTAPPNHSAPGHLPDSSPPPVYPASRPTADLPPTRHRSLP